MEAAAWSSLISVPTRRNAYTPTLVITANTAATGATATEYVLGNQKLNGQAPAFTRNAMPRIAAPVSNSVRCAGSSELNRCARSAMLSVPTLA